MGIFDDLPLPPEKSVSYISSFSDLFIVSYEAWSLLGLGLYVSDTTPTLTRIITPNYVIFSDY